MGEFFKKIEALLKFVERTWKNGKF